jgi:hypothetical protein
MSEYRVYTIGADGHIFKAEAMICQNDEEAIVLVRTPDACRRTYD